MPRPRGDVEFLAAAALAVDPAQMVYVGDTELDLRAAHAAGSQAAWVRWGYGDETRCLAAEPHTIIDSPAAFETLIPKATP